MLKKLLLLTAVLAFAVPAMAQTGKWNVEIGAWDAQPRGQELTYAFDAYDIGMYNYQGHVGDFGIGRAYQTELGRHVVPTFKIGYTTGDWTTWLSYSHFSKSQSGTTAGSSVIAPSIGYAWWGWNYANYGTFSSEMKQNLYDLDFGRTFHPAAKWNLMLYTGLKYMKLDSTENIFYADNTGYSYNRIPPIWGNPVLTNSAKGFGLNFGLKSTFNAGRVWSFTGGAELSLTSVKNDIMRTEVVYADYFSPVTDTPAYRALLQDNPSASLHYVTPGVKLFLETKVKFTPNWYAKLGYRFDAYKDLIRYYRSTNWQAGAFTPEAQNLTMQGFYISTGFTW